MKDKHLSDNFLSLQSECEKTSVVGDENNITSFVSFSFTAEGCLNPHEKVMTSI